MTAHADQAPAARATAAQWLEGARPRTLPAAITPVVAATGLVGFEGRVAPVAALLALLVSLALQVGVNFANDYSDGIRGTDADRVGPLRLVGSGLARPAAVRAAAFASFGVAAVAGVVLVLLTGHWWLLAVGAASVLAAWYYTGGRRPYGYRGLGEAFVFVFFGLVAVCGTGYVQTGRVTLALVLTGVWVGALTTAVLVANNLRDLRGDAASGKLTLATRLGDRRTRSFYVALVAVAALGLAAVAALTTVWALLGLLPLLLLVRPCRAVLSGSVGRDLIAVLKATGLAGLLASVVSAVALLLA
ncbi:1,4-dihydroxy-2-naphthoate polyprenyltransferase [Microlunatus spumicola]|uniref:1,4-dihydroxy-2-naphthoate octaprenyltransferase n=1 Tax=Microlunatus spumicola TaxID=81499 RepID=A0ABP6YH39_9ACTN